MYTLILFLLVSDYSALADKEFVCTNGNSINIIQICDGENHCEDGSDETKKLCLNVICPTDKFRCHYGACIENSLKCDGIKNCFDGSDEYSCEGAHSCKKNEFQCANGKCIGVTKLCDNTFDCSDGLDEDSDLCQKISCPLNSYRCKVGGCIHLNARCNGHNDCIDGSDETDVLCKCLKKNCDGVTCPPITSHELDVKCTDPEKGIVSCNKPVSVHTKAKGTCKVGYIPKGGDSSNIELICQPDGSWNREISHCVVDCGRTGEVASPLIVHGFRIESKQVPWHVVLYLKQENTWDFICGGTLISDQIVVTAAHCTWEIAANELKIAVGRTITEESINVPGSEFREVAKIFRHPLYQDVNGNYGSDITLLFLKDRVTLSSTVRPACIDWAWNEVEFRKDAADPGLIAGMGFTEEDKHSSDLLGTYLKFIEETNCMKSQKEDFRKYLTLATFCAGWANGTGVCNGDSGGGLVFPMKKYENRWALQGVVSLSPRQDGEARCDPKYYTIFTKVGLYIGWIKSVLQHIQNGTPYP